MTAAAVVALSSCGDGNGGDGGEDGGGDERAAWSVASMTEPPRENWVTNGGSLDNMRYSPLDQIDRENVDELKGQWQVSLDGSGDDPKHSAEAQPLVHDGVIYVITGDDDVFAIDVETGEQKWKYEANLDEKISTVCCGWTSRGVAIGEDKVFVGQLDAKLVALDIETGERTWEAEVGDWRNGETITSAPLYYDGLVYTGLSGGEFGIRGRLTAYDAETGKEQWKFWTIPGPGETGHDTWPQDNDAWKNGGAPVWQTPAVDPELDTMYFSTGNVAPDFIGANREGDNLFSASVVAIDPKSGEYKWHFQQVHHDIWDYDSPSPVVLFDIEIDGEQRKGLASPSKTGWVYILDRETGEPLIGIEERPVPQEPRQKTSPTQPFPKGDSFTPQRITQGEVDSYEQTGDPQWEYVNQGRIFTPFWGQTGIVAKPGTLGGNNWPPSSFNPDTGFLYVCSSDTASIFTSTEVDFSEVDIAKGEQFLGSAFNSPKGSKLEGTVTAMDMRDNTIAWQERWDTNCYSGTVTTAGGLVFVGHNDGTLRALHSESGEQLWSFQTGAGANSTATIFEHGGEQYIAFYAGGNSLSSTPHGDNLWLFSLDGDVGPAPEPGELREAEPPEEDEAAEGQPGEKPEEGVTSETNPDHGGARDE